MNKRRSMAQPGRTDEGTGIIYTVRLVERRKERMMAGKGRQGKSSYLREQRTRHKRPWEQSPHEKGHLPKPEIVPLSSALSAATPSPAASTPAQLEAAAKAFGVAATDVATQMKKALMSMSREVPADILLSSVIDAFPAFGRALEMRNGIPYINDRMVNTVEQDRLGGTLIVTTRSGGESIKYKATKRGDLRIIERTLEPGWGGDYRATHGHASLQYIPSLDDPLDEKVEPLVGSFDESRKPASTGTPATTKPKPKLQKADCWTIAEAVLRVSRRTLLYGVPGTGKTYAAAQVGLREGQALYIVTITEDMPASELRGMYVPHGDHFEWHHGPAVRAWLEGARLVLNEIDHGSGDVQTLLHVILDDVETAKLTLPTGETVRPVEGFTVVATMNGVPQDLPVALRDRFASRVKIDQVHPAALAALPEDIREQAKKTTLIADPNRRFSIRTWMEYAQLREQIGEEHAALAVFGDQAEAIYDALMIAGTRQRTQTTQGEDLYATRAQVAQYARGVGESAEAVRAFSTGVLAGLNSAMREQEQLEASRWRQTIAGKWISVDIKAVSPGDIQPVPGQYIELKRGKPDAGS